MKKNVLPAFLLLIAACQSPASKQAAEKDSVAVADSTEVPRASHADSVATVDTVHIDTTLLPGKWLQPVPGIDSMDQGFILKKNGKAASVNMHTLIYDNWRVVRDTLILGSHSEGVKNPSAVIDTLLIKALNDSVMVLFPISAAQGYEEKYTRRRKGK